jgi:hypothetical protein
MWYSLNKNVILGAYTVGGAVMFKYDMYRIQPSLASCNFNFYFRFFWWYYFLIDKYKSLRIIIGIWTARHSGIEVGGIGINTINSLLFNIAVYLFAVYLVAVYLIAVCSFFLRFLGLYYSGRNKYNSRVKKLRTFAARYFRPREW